MPQPSAILSLMSGIGGFAPSRMSATVPAGTWNDPEVFASEPSEAVLLGITPEQMARIEEIRAIKAAIPKMVADDIAGKIAEEQRFIRDGGYAAGGKVYRSLTGNRPVAEELDPGFGQRIDPARPDMRHIQRAAAVGRAADEAAAVAKAERDAQAEAEFIEAARRNDPISRSQYRPDPDKRRQGQYASYEAINARRLEAGLPPISIPGKSSAPDEKTAAIESKLQSAAGSRADAVRNNNAVFAQMAKHDRMVANGEMSPLSALEANQRLLQNVKNYDSRLDASGMASAEWYAANPAAAAAFDREHNAAGLGKRALDVQEKDIDNRLTAVKDTNKTQAGIAKGDQAVQRAGIKSSERVNRYIADTGVKRSQIEADSRNHGIDVESAVAMRQLDINDKMTDAQIENLSAMTGIKRDELEKSHEARMEALKVSREEVKKQYNAQILLGKNDHEARMFANETMRQQVGGEIADRAAGRLLESQKFQHAQYMDRDQLAAYRANSAQEASYKKELLALDREALEIKKKDSEAAREVQLLDAATRTRVGDANAQAALIDAKVKKSRLEIEAKQVAEQVENTRQQTERLRIDNKNLEGEAKAKAVERELFPKSMYPETSDRLDAKAKFLSENSDKLLISADGSVPPIVPSYLADLRESSGLWNKVNNWTDAGNETEFRLYAITNLASTMKVNDLTAQYYVDKFLGRTPRPRPPSPGDRAAAKSIVGAGLMPLGIQPTNR